MRKLCHIFSLVVLWQQSSIGPAEAEQPPDSSPEKGRVIPVTSAPYLAALYYKGAFKCSGSIVAPRWILTTGHCVTHPDGAVYTPEQVTVYVGLNDARVVDDVTRLVDLVLVHPHYAQYRSDYEVGLLKLFRPVEYSERVRCIKMAPVGTSAPQGTAIVATAYGMTAQDTPFPEDDTRLRAIDVAVENHLICREQYVRTGLEVTDRMFCAGLPYSATCHRNSGGPATHLGQLLGVILGGNLCAELQFPGVYTLVPSVRDWIDETVALYSKQNPAEGMC